MIISGDTIGDIRNAREKLIRASWLIGSMLRPGFFLGAMKVPSPKIMRKDEGTVIVMEGDNDFTLGYKIKGGY
jgi:hypothetical protein